jgi:FAD:protein FMN transferase
MKSLVVLACAIGFLTISVLARSELREVREVHYQMGTVLDITLWHPDAGEAKKLVRRSVQEVHRLEGILSNYDPESSLSSFNERAGRGRVKLDADLFRVLDLATTLSRRTAGYFDVTIGPLVALWQRAVEKGSLPKPEVLSQNLNLVGADRLKLYQTGEAELLYDGMKIDLGGIGKGYAVDRIVEMFRTAGVKSALVNFGGSSIYALGNPPDEDGWGIGVQGIDDHLIGMVRLKNRGLSTSGSMGRSWKIQGVRYGHLINPKSGLPVAEHRSATAIAATATEAEALTKPPVLLGSPGMALIKNFPGTEALLVSDGDRLYFSQGFAAATHFQRVDRQ